MGLTTLALRIAAPAPKVESFSRYLFVGPHPDDIEIGCGATAAKLAASGKQVTFLICADGRYGDGASGGIRGDDLAALRMEEAKASAERLGVTDVRFLGLCDGGFYRKEELLRGIARVVGECRPELLFAPDPSTGRECHIDHLRTGRVSSQVAFFAPYAGIMERYGAESADVQGIAFYMTARPNRFVRTSKALFRQQQDAIFSCHRSQYADDEEAARSIALYLRLRAADLGLRCGSLYAEGFRVLGQTQMHCLPESY